MTGNKEAHLRIELYCEMCEEKTRNETEMKLLTDVEGTDRALYQCPHCRIKVTLRAYLDN